MIKNLAEMFMPEQEVYLDNIVYEKKDVEINEEEHTLKCEDNITVNSEEDGVLIIVTRILNFEPEELFSLRVSFGAMLKFAPGKKELYEWDNMNLAEEFRMNGDFITANLMARISNQIAQITSAAGQIPLILPPSVARKN